MPEGVSRTVRMGSMAYVDPSGFTRRADRGAEVLVHPDHVARFDRLNVPQVAEPDESSPVDSEPVEVPKRRPGRPRKAESEG